MKKENALFILCLSFACFANGLSKTIDFKADWALFPYPSGQTLMEVYYRFAESDLHFKKSGDTYSAGTIGNWQMFRSDTLFGNYFWKNQRVIDDTASSVRRGEVIDQINGTFPPGKYRCKFIVSELEHPDNKDSTEFEVTVTSPGAGPLELSDIELSAFIQKPVRVSDSPFFKNNMIVVPNAGGVFVKNTRIYFYLEARDNDPRRSKKYDIQYFLRDSTRTRFTEKRQKPAQWERGSFGFPQIGSIDTDTLAEGSYALVINFIDEQGNSVASREKTVILTPAVPMTSPNRPAVNEPVPDEEFAAMDSAAVELEFLYIRYLLTPDARTVWGNLKKHQAKKSFVSSFWKNYSEMILRENRVDRQGYLSRIQHANDEFKVFNRAGWKTDRGRIYALYGEPEVIDRFPNEPNLNPYEVWHYQKLQNGVLFVFCDLAGHRDYELIHSTLIGEEKNYDYMEVIRRGSY